MSIDGLIRTKAIDSDGDTDVDVSQHIKIPIDAGTGERTEARGTYNGTYTPSGSNSLRDQTIIVTSADGKNRTTNTDADGNGSADTADATILTLDGAGNSTSTREIKNSDGSLRFKTWFEQSAEALDVSKHYDMNGDGTYDTTTHDVTSFNAGERAENLVVSNEDGRCGNWRMAA